jgi:hypothetical protein
MSGKKTRRRRPATHTGTKPKVSFVASAKNAAHEGGSSSDESLGPEDTLYQTVVSEGPPKKSILESRMSVVETIQKECEDIASRYERQTDAYDDYLGSKVGGGNYSSVYKYIPHKDLAVIKRGKVRDDREFDYMTLSRERRIFHLTNDMVFNGETPHFPIMFESVDWGDESAIWFVLEAGLKDGETYMDDLSNHFKHGKITRDVLETSVAQMTAQALLGIHALHHKLDVVHNDFCARNILQENTNAAVLEYQLGDKFPPIRLKTSGNLFKIIDFGMASGPSEEFYDPVSSEDMPKEMSKFDPSTWTVDLFPYPHNRVCEIFFDNPKKNDWYTHKNFDKHVTQFERVPPYVRDALFFLVHLCSWNSGWAKFASRRVEVMVRRDQMPTHKDWTMELFQEIFEEGFLAKNGIKHSDIFDTSEQPVMDVYTLE